MKTKYIVVAFLAILLVYSCATRRKADYLNNQAVTAGLSFSKEEDDPNFDELQFGVKKRDTITVSDMDGREVLVMKAVRDDETGEMIANDVINAAVISSRFSNIAERAGKVDICFKVTVPAAMKDSKWQLRFYPDMFMLGDSIALEPVIITGTEYRKAQLKGYQQYEKFLSRIITDSTKFIDLRQLELFLQRNIPQIYAFKNDTTVVSDEEFYSEYGVSEQDAIQHYTNTALIASNNRLISRKKAMFDKYVKNPIINDGIRLDTVIVNTDGDFEYDYVQTINVRPKLKKVDIKLGGEIFDEDKKVYDIPRSEPLTFYISSLSSFADNTEKYLTKVTERRAEANTECHIDFEVGKSDIKPQLHDNFYEIRNIKMTLEQILGNEIFILDSLTINATASPEGTYAFNKKLAHARSTSVAKYFGKYANHITDSLSKEKGMFIDMANADFNSESNINNKVSFIPRSTPENWEDLDYLVLSDIDISEADKDSYRKICDIEDPDVREHTLQKEPYYARIKELYYPRLRTVKFNFFLHRAKMTKDTVHTTIPDTVYMAGVKALKNMEYELALSYLRSYNDFNTAVAYAALNRNQSALSILSRMEKKAEVNYLLAVIFSRLGRTQEAIQAYVTSCQQNRMFIHRGNLDPEISHLIKEFNLNSIIDKDDFEY